MHDVEKGVSSPSSTFAIHFEIVFAAFIGQFLPDLEDLLSRIVE